MTKKTGSSKQVTLRLSTEMFQQPWTGFSIRNHLENFFMKDSPTPTLAHRIFKEELDTWQIDYDSNEFRVTFKIETLCAIFAQVKYPHDIQNLFVKNFVLFLDSKQALAKSNLSKQARLLTLSNMVRVDINE